MDTITVRGIEVHDDDHEVQIEMPNPGAYLVKGPKASGKSSLLRTLMSVLTSDRKNRPTISRGSFSDEGLVTYPGGQCRITRTRMKYLGDPSVKVFDLQPALALYDPPFKGAKERQKARIKAFATLTGVVVPVSDIIGPCGLPATPAPLHEAAEAARKYCLGQQGIAKVQAAKHEATVTALRAQMVPGLTSSISSSDAAEALAEARSHAELTRVGASSRRAHEKQQATIRASHGARPDVEGAEHESTASNLAYQKAKKQDDESLITTQRLQRAYNDAASAEATIGGQVAATTNAIKLWVTATRVLQSSVPATLPEGNDAIDSIWNSVGDILLEPEIAGTATSKARDRMVNAREKSILDSERENLAANLAGEAANRLTRARVGAATWDKMQELLSQPAEGPSDKEEAEANQALTLASEAHANAKACEANEAVKNSLKAAKVAAETATIEAKKWAKLVKTGIPKKVGELLKAANAPGWSISHDGKLMMDEHGRPVPFADLSGGQQLEAAILLALGGAEKATGDVLMILSQKQGMELHPPQWMALARLAQEKGIYILSAEKGEIFELVEIAA